MGFAWNAFAVPGTLAMLTSLAMSILVFSLAQGRSQNRRLAVLLVNEAIVIGGGAGILYFLDERRDVFATQSFFVSAMIAGPFLYLWFVSTLSTPLVRWLKPKPVQWGVLGAGLACEIYWLTHPFAFVPDIVPVWYAPWEAVLSPTFLLFWTLGGLVSLYAVFCTISAYRRAPKGTVLRSRAKAYAIAFITRDIVYILVTFVLPLFVAPPPSGTWWDAVYIWGYAFASLALCGGLAYGIVKTQLFDIDLRLKITIRRGALAGAFVAVFFVASEVAQRIFEARFGPIVGLAAAGLLVFAIAPLQNAADRVANAAMPSVNASSEYLSFRKLQVYRAALEGATEDGAITTKERAMLGRLRAELGIRDEDAQALERDILPTGGAPA